MNLRESIEQYQLGKNNSLVDELLDLALHQEVKTEMISSIESVDTHNNGNVKKYKRYRPKYSPLTNSMTDRLVFNFRVMFARYNRPATKVRNSYLFEGDNEDIVEYDALGMIYETLKGIGHEYYKDDFDKVTDEMIEMVYDKFGSERYIEFKDEFMEFKRIVPVINKGKEKYDNQLRPLMKQALHHMLLRVNLSNTDDMVIGYIAKGVRNETYKLLDKQNGVVTFNRNGERYFLKEDSMILNGAKNLINCKKYNPTKSQKQFISELTELIDEEVINRNTKLFAFDKDYNLIDFNKRYFAEKMGLTEDNFKHKIRRLQQV